MSPRDDPQPQVRCYRAIALQLSLKLRNASQNQLSAPSAVVTKLVEVMVDALPVGSIRRHDEEQRGLRRGRSSSTLCSTSANGARTCTGFGASGTTHSTRPIARIEKMPTSVTSPLMRSQWNTIGAPTIATANDTPMLPPTIAIAVVRCSSDVRSAMNAITPTTPRLSPGSGGRR
jgi:hypothetical protein